MLNRNDTIPKFNYTFAHILFVYTGKPFPFCDPCQKVESPSFKYVSNFEPICSWFDLLQNL